MHRHVEAVEVRQGLGDRGAAEVAVVLLGDEVLVGDDLRDVVAVALPDLRRIASGALADVCPALDQEVALGVDHVVDDVGGGPARARARRTPVGRWSGRRHDG